MPAKRKYELSKFLEVLSSSSSLSTGIIARKLKCHISTALRYLRELKASKQVIEQRISNTINLWKLTGKRILLVDVDSKIPNLALMKISTWHKACGDNVALLRGSMVDLSTKPDKVYASIVFKKNRNALDYLLSQHSDIDIDVGGSGYDLTKELPDHIENMAPDYSLYPENDSSLGFSSRGCFRACDFCIVRKKEGTFRRTQHPQQWYNPKFRKITFLDNNILADKDWFMKITDWCIARGLKVWFTQGLDIRLVDSEIAKRLFEIRNHHMLSFAWDNLADESTIREKIELLKQAGFTKNMLRARIQFYVYVDSDEDYESGVYRCRELKKLNCNSYVMYNIDNKQTSRIIDLKRWSKGKVYFWYIDLVDFDRRARSKAVKT